MVGHVWLQLPNISQVFMLEWATGVVGGVGEGLANVFAPLSNIL